MWRVYRNYLKCLIVTKYICRFDRWFKSHEHKYPVYTYQNLASAKIHINKIMLLWMKKKKTKQQYENRNLICYSEFQRCLWNMFFYCLLSFSLLSHNTKSYYKNAGIYSSALWFVSQASCSQLLKKNMEGSSRGVVFTVLYAPLSTSLVLKKQIASTQRRQTE